MKSKCIAVFVLSMVVLAGSAPIARGQGCPGSGMQSNGPDVTIHTIVDVFNHDFAGAKDAISLGSDGCNLGNQVVLWDACPATTHPVFGGTAYRWQTVAGATRFEQIGQSWLKHGFAAAQDFNCCPTCQPSGNSARLGLGCDDVYFGFQAGIQGGLGPKYLVNPHTGIYPGSMCTIHPSSGNTGRLEVPAVPLTSGGPGASVRLFGQVHYVTFDDALFHNQNNNATSVEFFTIMGDDGRPEYQLFQGGPTYSQVPAIRIWKMIDAGVVETDVLTPEDDGFPGLVILAAKATNLGNGFWRYEYAVNNMNSDRSIAAFSVPCSAYATILNLGFNDVDYVGGDGNGGINYSGADWPGAFTNGSVRWATTPFASDNNANAIRWGTLYNFRFDANTPPASGNVTLTEFKVVTDLLAATVIPSAVNCTKGDMNADGLIDGRDIALFAQLLVSGGATPAQKCTGDVQPVPNYALDEADVNPFINCLLNGNCS